MNEVRLQIENLESFIDRSMEMAKRLDAGERTSGDSHISFETMEGLLKVLTPNRWVLLRTLRGRGPSSIRALARDLDRDYRGVHADVAMLVEAGLVERDRKGAVSVPWSRITAEMALDAAA
ncbi:DNA-binding protein [Inquilinus sp. CAU 1745]|uniref:HVO_A0114 family putative DNA-binding protein n=1 Tax=Inquilinus sp. CAU 1745 TaxID=3140369 RepID=UPI00325C1BD0